METNTHPYDTAIQGFIQTLFRGKYAPKNYKFPMGKNTGTIY